MNLTQVRRVFEDNAVQRALVVDDVFDDIAEFSDDDLQIAFQLLEEDDEVQAALITAGGVMPTAISGLADQLAVGADLTIKLNQSLSAANDTPLRKLAFAIFGTAAEDKATRAKPLQDLEALLTDLGIAVDPVGSDGPSDAATRYPLIFMDYYLGKKGAPSVQKSVDQLRTIVAQYPANERPIVVLMSSELARRKTALEFRDKSELLGSQFDFVTKDRFSVNGTEFVISLADLVQFSSQGRTIGGFVDAWKSALTDASSDFVRGIRKLDLQDYFHFQLKLGDDAKHRFGEALGSLFVSYLQKMLEDRPELRNSTQQMNSLDFANRPPSPFQPSEIVAAIAYASAFQDLLPVVPGAKSTIELGDVWVRDFKKGKTRELTASIVISQACDLEHGKVDTAFLIDGTMTRHSATKARPTASEDRHAVLRVDLLRYDKEDYTVEWDARRLRVEKVAGFDAALADHGYQKIARLRTVQALALQQKFASHVTRVGLPDSMQAYRYTNAEVYIRNGGGKQLLREFKVATQMTCLVGEEQQEAVLMTEMFTQIRAALETLDRTGLDDAQIDAAIASLSDIEQVRNLRTIKLTNGQEIVGNIGVTTSDEAWVAGNAIPKGMWLAINLFR